MAFNREEKALRGFKKIITNLVFMLRQAAGAETVYLVWVNRSRRQFVLEARSTTISNVVFPDRTDFDNHFLEPWKDREKVFQLDIGVQLKAEQLSHYHEKLPVGHLLVIPFVNNGETVALTVMESSGKQDSDSLEPLLSNYISALSNVLNTYLELTDHLEKQKEWVSYEESLSRLSPRLHKVEILDRMLEEMQRLLPQGGVSLVTRGMDVWTNVLHAENAKNVPPVGLMIDESSIAYSSLQKGEPVFSIHFNQNPKRLAAGEPVAEGSTLAIPMIIDDRRHAVVVAFDSNPLTFRESVKHQLINMVRTAGLMIRINLGKLPVERDLLTSDFGSFIPDLWEKTLETAIRTAAGAEHKTWFGLITIENLTALRSRYRLEDLNRLQRTLVKVLNPSRIGFNGYIGFHSDYIFSFIIQDSSENAAERYWERVRQVVSKPLTLGNGEKMDVALKTGSTRVDGTERDAHQVLRKAKDQLSRMVGNY